ncbi:MAG: SpoIVB peptidase S55 domain protein [Selenomonas sp.]|nr:SpoIVB peptidase S55 domain protein [Selenomonas sp.]
MRNYIKRLAAAGMAVMFLSVQSVPAMAMDPILPHDQVKEGMTGTAYTVVDSSGELKDFQVDVVGNLDNGKGSEPMIMARASGPVIQQTGGILQGMSGSPVYVDGYLIGAVAAGIKEMSPYTFFITPIDAMIPLWKMPDLKNRTHIHTINLKRAAESQANQENKEKKDAEQAAKSNDGKVHGATLLERAKAALKSDAAKADDTAKADAAKNASSAKDDKASADKKTAATTAEAAASAAAKPAEASGKAVPKSVMYFSGFNQAGLNFLKQQIDPKGIMQFMPMGAPSLADMQQTDYNAKLVPGSAVGVAVTYGDFAVGATGTVTAVDGKNILAFGHPFLHRGNVNYFMTDAKVVGTISGQSNGMKIANIGNIIGRISQDRATGIAGTLGTFPSVVPVKVRVQDNSLGRTDNYGARIAYDEDFLAQLSGGIAYAALSKTADDLSGSTAKVGFRIRTNAVKDGVVSRSNMFYNTADVGQISMAELMQAMSIICQNTEKESDIIDVQVDITVDNDRKTASLVSAVPDKKKVKPGETVKFTTTLKPYRRAKETMIIPFTVPENQPEGTLNLDIRGGGLVPATALMLLQQSGVDVTNENDAKQTTADKLKKLQENGRNNEIIIAPGPVQKQLSAHEQRKLMREAAEAQGSDAPREITLLDSKAAKPKAGETKFETNYIIDNVIHSALQIERK